MPVLSCGLSPQRCVPQDTGFSSLFLKVLMQTLQWLDGSAGEGGPLQAQLKLFAAQYSARRRISDGECWQVLGGGASGLRPLPWGQGRGADGFLSAGVLALVLCRPQMDINVDVAEGLES